MIILHMRLYDVITNSLFQNLKYVRYFNRKPNIPWPLYSREKPLFKYIGPNDVTGKNGLGPHKQNCDFMRPYF